jgi:Ca2+-transporting ATPase
MNTYYQQKTEDVIHQLNSSANGLTKAAAIGLQKQHGPNALQEAKRKSKLTIFLSQFKDVMIFILIVAAGISFFVGEHIDAYVILIIIMGNAWMGFYQEYNAEQSIRMLQKMAAQNATALRDGNPEKIEASQLVPGDVILLEAGDIVPADARLMEVNAMRTEEAALTGESQPVEKMTEPLTATDLLPGDQVNMLFKGTIVSNGTAKAIVTATGMNTEIGKIAGLLDTESQQTPLQHRLSTFSKQLAVAVIVICGIVFVFGLWRGEPTYTMFLTALSLAVAALPEALPAVITIALAQGAHRMAKQKALVRRLPAVETLGSVTYICSDKTGTLTQNVMTVEKIQAAPEMEHLLQHAMILNNDVKFSQDEGLMGDSTEIALVKYATDAGNSKEHSDAEFPLVAKIPFDSERMRMSTLHRQGDKWMLFVKGAPVKVIEVLSEKYKDQAPALIETNRAWAKEGLRVLFFSYKIFDTDPGEINQQLEKDLDYLGMVAMMDPPREEVIEAIKQCKTAGIKSVMITGDQALTAFAIAERLDIVDDQHQNVKTGAELAKMPEEELAREIKNILVYARVSPEQKLNIVKALQHNGEFVAMTGDGVNDAPSLNQADIGVAMGITGTDVSKEAADMILMDDNFATIVKAVKEGRRIYENIKKFILYVLSCNLAEVLTIFFAPVLGFAIPLLPTHILWINLVTDGLPGLALVSELAEKDVMQRPPIPPKTKLFAGGLAIKILIAGTIMACAAIGVQWWAVYSDYDIRTQQTMIFTLLCFIQLGNAISVRSVNHSMFSSNFFSNWRLWGAIGITVLLQAAIIYVPVFQLVFKTTALSIEKMAVILVVTFIAFLCFELIKHLRFLRKN